MTDKNFDDTELEDIMKEIEELEGADNASLSADESESSDPVATASEADIEDIIEQELEELNQIENVASVDEEDTEVLGEMIEEALSEEGPKSQILQNDINSKIESVVESPGENHKENVVPLKEKTMSDSNTGSPCQMSLNVSGEMNINLDFAISGQKVELVISEEKGLEIILNDGARFTLPVDHTGKKVA